MPPDRSNCCLGVDDAINQAAATVHRVQDLCLCQKHEVLLPLLNGTNRLVEAKSAAVPNIVRPQVESWGFGADGAVDTTAPSEVVRCHVLSYIIKKLAFFPRPRITD